MRYVIFNHVVVGVVWSVNCLLESVVQLPQSKIHSPIHCIQQKAWTRILLIQILKKLRLSGLRLRSSLSFLQFLARLLTSRFLIFLCNCLSLLSFLVISLLFLISLPLPSFSSFSPALFCLTHYLFCLSVSVSVSLSHSSSLSSITLPLTTLSTHPPTHTQTQRECVCVCERVRARWVCAKVCQREGGCVSLWMYCYKPFWWFAWTIIHLVSGFRNHQVLGAVWEVSARWNVTKAKS